MDKNIILLGALGVGAYFLLSGDSGNQGLQVGGDAPAGTVIPAMAQPTNNTTTGSTPQPIYNITFPTPQNVFPSFDYTPPSFGSDNTTKKEAATVKQLVKTDSGYGYVEKPISPIMLNLAGGNPANVPSLAQGIIDMNPNQKSLNQVYTEVTKKQIQQIPATPQSTVNNFMSKASGGGSSSGYYSTPTVKANATATQKAISTFRNQAPKSGGSGSFSFSFR